MTTVCYAGCVGTTSVSVGYGDCAAEDAAGLPKYDWNTYTFSGESCTVESATVSDDVAKAANAAAASSAASSAEPTTSSAEPTTSSAGPTTSSAGPTTSSGTGTDPNCYGTGHGDVCNGTSGSTGTGAGSGSGSGSGAGSGSGTSGGTGTGTGSGSGSGSAVSGSPSTGDEFSPPSIATEPKEGKSFWKSKYPDGYAAAFQSKVGQFKNTALFGVLDAFNFQLDVNGSWPDVVFDFDFGDGLNFGSYSLSDNIPKLALLIGLLKFLVIFWALLGARSDIFGG